MIIQIALGHLVIKFDERPAFPDKQAPHRQLTEMGTLFDHENNVSNKLMFKLLINSISILNCNPIN